MANYWVHNGYVTVDGEKMSKSVGNFTTVRDALSKHRGEAVRYALLNAHYRAPLDYSDGAVAEAKQALDRLYRAAGDAAPASHVPEAFLSALQDDLNTPLALSILHDLARSANKGDEEAAKGLKGCANMLGLLNHTQSDWMQSAGDISGLTEADIDTAIAARQQARIDRDFAKADAIRDELAEKGIQLLDGPEGTSWQRQ